MIVAGIVIGYSFCGLLMARHTAYRCMVFNETHKFAGTPLEARLYSKGELVDIANNALTGMYARSVARADVPRSDYTEVILRGIFWWAYLATWTLRALVLGGHKKTPGQSEAELKAREEAAAKREAEAEELRRKYDQEFEERMKEINGG